MTVFRKTNFQGIPIHLDRPKGFIQKGKDEHGKEWSRKYLYDYGFIPGTHGGDGDDLDVFIGPDKKQQTVFFVIQNHADKSFDEYKAFLGFADKKAAIAAYKQHIPAKFMGKVISMNIDLLKAMTGARPQGIAKIAGLLDELSSISLNPINYFFSNR